ncbi:ATP-binding protein [Acidisphaera sp. L21]|uniref:ATP-binding protein n=1 Tax=Acidisphaera sp. L21 TaxID=1641851 RepID=UPI00131D7353|nr:ATP-binding protein [Acidisphaera sp. L21]
MSHTPPARLRMPQPTIAPALMSHEDPSPDAIAMRQLRHQTKNALQRIIAQVAACDLRATPAGAILADEIERRVLLSARVSDALFGMTAFPGPLRDRLMALCTATVRLLADTEQTIETDIELTGACPAALHSLMVKTAHEMVTNAVKHGMHMRLVGKIRVLVHGHSDGSTTLQVRNDGWQLSPDCEEGDGLPIMRLLADPHGGTVSMRREDGWTIATMHVPCSP